MIDSLEPIIICNKCRIARIVFDGSQRGPSGRLIPLDYKTNQIHVCDLSESFPCKICNEQIYLDRKVLSPTGKRIPLSAIDGKPHDCPTNKNDVHSI